MQGEYKNFGRCFHRLLDGVPNDLLKTESHYQTVMHTTCLLTPGVAVRSELHTRSPELPHAIILMEFKRDKSAQTGFKQISDRECWGLFREEGNPVAGSV